MSDLSKHLLSSSKFFTAEAARNAVSANSGDVVRWQLALLHIVTALEHSAKSLLAMQHPAFVRDTFERPAKTVGIEKAFERIADKTIVGVSLSAADKTKVRTAIGLRNDIAHGSAGHNPSALAAKFFEVFAFQREFLRLRLGVKLEDFMDYNEAKDLLKIQQHSDELFKRAKSAISENEGCFVCAECTQDFLVIREDTFLCLFCHSEEEISDCDRCHRATPHMGQFRTEELFEYEFGGGGAEMVFNYNISETIVCESCFDEIEEEVSKMKEEIAYDQWEDELYFMR